MQNKLSPTRTMGWQETAGAIKVPTAVRLFRPSTGDVEKVRKEQRGQAIQRKLNSEKG